MLVDEVGEGAAMSGQGGGGGSPNAGAVGPGGPTPATGVPGAEGGSVVAPMDRPVDGPVHLLLASIATGG